MPHLQNREPALHLPLRADVFNCLHILILHFIDKAASLEPWFPAHLQRDIYFSLLHLEPSASSPKEKKTPAIPDSVLKASLLRRASEDIRRIMALRSQKQALAMLLQRGSVGDDLWQRFQRAEKEMEDEVKDVVSEVWLNPYVSSLATAFLGEVV
jgi:translocation protein SEC66